MRYFFASVSVVLALATGCAPSNPGLVIDGVLAPPTGGLCTFDPGVSVFLGSGTLDTLNLRGMFVPDPAAFGPRYVGAFRVSNRLINLFNGTHPLRADPNVMLLMAADIEITNIDGSLANFGALPNPFRVAVGGSVPSAASEAPGVAVVFIELIPAQYAAALAGADGLRLIAGITLIGRTTGDATVVSAEFLFPIDVCTSCLFACAGTAADVESACSFGQDSVSTLPPGSVLPEITCPVAVGP